MTLASCIFPSYGWEDKIALVKYLINIRDVDHYLSNHGLGQTVSHKIYVFETMKLKTIFGGINNELWNLWWSAVVKADCFQIAGKKLYVILSL